MPPKTCISTSVNQTTPPPPYTSEDTKYISTLVDQTRPMPARTKKVFQLVLTKPLLCQRRNKIYLKLYQNASNMCWRNTSYASEDNILSCVNLIHPKVARTQYARQLVLTQPIPCRRGHKVYFKMCSQIPSNEATKCIKTCIDQTPLCLRGHN